MTTSKRSLPGGNLETRILEELSELKGKVDESLDMGKENNSELKGLRKELGLDGPHGRLPLVEASIQRHENRMDKIDDRLHAIENRNTEIKGGSKAVHGIISVLSGGGAGAVLTYFLSHFWLHR